MTELKKSIKSLLDKGSRLDGRKFDEYREISIETDISANAEGSARVRIGDTEVLAGVKMELSTPYPDTPEDGGLMINVELLTMSSPEFEKGPPGDQAIEIARVTDRVLRESKIIDTKKLCLIPGEKVWTVIVDIVTINDGGNLFDASSIAAAAAIKNAVFPEVEDGKVNYKKRTDKKIPVDGDLPINVTLLKIGEHVIVDPTSKEDLCYDARLSVGVRPDGKYCSMQKGGDEAITLEDLDLMLDLAKDKALELMKYL